MPTWGLLNVVAAPHLAVASTYMALTPKLPRPQRDPVCVFTSPKIQLRPPPCLAPFSPHRGEGKPSRFRLVQ